MSEMLVQPRGRAATGQGRLGWYRTGPRLTPRCRAATRTRCGTFASVTQRTQFEALLLYSRCRKYGSPCRVMSAPVMSVLPKVQAHLSPIS